MTFQILEILTNFPKIKNRKNWLCLNVNILKTKASIDKQPVGNGPQRVALSDKPKKYVWKYKDADIKMVKNRQNFGENLFPGVKYGSRVFIMAHLWPFDPKYGPYGPVLRDRGPYYGPW